LGLRQTAENLSRQIDRVTYNPDWELATSYGAESELREVPRGV